MSVAPHPCKRRTSTQESSGLSSSPSDLSPLLKRARLASNSPPPHPPGLFANSSDVDASHSLFLDVIGNDNKIQINTPDLLDKLPRAKPLLQDHIEKCLFGTRKAELQRIKEWEEDDKRKPVCWVRGIPGSGKSTIALTFAESSSANGRLRVIFVCSREFKDRRAIHRIFPTLAYSLAAQSPDFKNALVAIIQENPDVGWEKLDIQFKNLIVRPLESTGILTTIIIDALDECEDHNPAAIFSVLANHIDSIPLVKILITGRPELPIRKGFSLSLHPFTEIFPLDEVDRVSVDQDIKLYLETGLSKIAAERSDVDLTDPWPTDEEIRVIVERCAGLFIVAYVIVNFVSFDYHDPKERLEVIVTRPNDTIHEGKLGVDEPYHQVLTQSFKEVDVNDGKFFDNLRLVIGSIAVIFDPLSRADLATVLDLKTNQVRTTLRSLHSIFIVPDSESEVIRICHKTLADFLTDKSRCTDPRFYINPPDLHLKLGLLCLRLMNTSLKTNICKLSRYAMNVDIEDLHERRGKYIGGGLEYGCKWWAMHLRHGSKGIEDVRQVEECLKEFFKHNLLAWLEVMSIVGDLQSAVYSLHEVTAWLFDTRSSDANLSAVVKDSQRFVLRFFDCIESSALHIYESALRWSPSSSRVRGLYSDQISPDVKISIIDDTWDSCIWAINTQDVESITFSHTNDLIAVGVGNSKNGVVEIFEAVTGKRRARLTTDRVVASLAFSPDDTLLATGGSDGIVNFWDLQTGSHVGFLEEHIGWVFKIAFSPCGTMIATYSADDTFRIWDTPFSMDDTSRDAFSFVCRHILEGHLDVVTTFCWLGREEVISGYRDATIKIWSIVDNECLRSFTPHTEPVVSVASSPDLSIIASGSQDGTVKVFGANTGDILHTIRINREDFNLVQFLDQDRIMYTDGKMFAIRDFKKGKDMLRLKCEASNAAISSDGTHLASSLGNVVKFWQTNSTNQNFPDVAGHHTDFVADIFFSMNGQLVATGSQDGLVKIWETSTGRCSTTFRGHRYGVLGVSISPDLTHCASWGKDHVIRLWDIRTGLVWTSGIDRYGVRTIRFSPDGSQLMSVKSSPGESWWFHIELWDVKTGERLASTVVGPELGSKYKDTSFDIDGTTVVMRFAGKMYRQRISPAPYTSNSSSLPLVFIPEQDPGQDMEIPPPSDWSDTSQYCHDRNGSWIMDRHRGRQVLWVPPDLREMSNCYGTKVVFASPSGRITVVELSLEQGIFSP